MNIRTYTEDDLDKVIDLYYDTVHSVYAADYTDEQMDAIAPKDVNRVHWATSLAKNHTLLAENEAGDLLGFGNIGETGFLDRLYVSKDHQGEGVGSALIHDLEAYARDNGNMTINTISSVTSLPFFEHMGYGILSEDITERHQVRVIQYTMEKEL